MTVDAMVKAVLDSAPLYVVIWEHVDGEFRFIDCNKRAAIMFGADPKQDAADTSRIDWPTVQPDGRDSADVIFDILTYVLEEGHEKQELMLINVQGQEMPFEFTFTRVALSERVFIIGYGYDLREVIAAREEALQNIKIMTDSVPVSMSMYDAETVQLIDCNAMAVATLGYDDKEEYISKYNADFYAFTPPMQPCGTPTHIKLQETLDALKRDGYCLFDWMHLTRTGEELLLNVSMVRIKQGDAYILVSYTQDLRAVKEAEAQRVADELAALEREKKFKENILATISHELRTPLAVMSVYAEMAVRQIKSGKVTEEALAALNTISDESHRLASLASNALDMFVKNASDETKAAVDMGKMVTRFADILDATATKRGIKIQTHVPEGLPQVWVISGELTRVFWNILDNALKHTKNGTIDIAVIAMPEKVMVSITDSGCGMDAETQARAFDKGFGQGAGLGLLFCKEIIEAHGGDIAIKSARGMGTSVTFSVPIARGV